MKYHYLYCTEKAADFFATIDLHCPRNYNPADFYITELAVIAPNEEECKEKINVSVKVKVKEDQMLIGYILVFT